MQGLNGTILYSLKACLIELALNNFAKVNQIIMQNRYRLQWWDLTGSQFTELNWIVLKLKYPDSIDKKCEKN